MLISNSQGISDVSDGLLLKHSFLSCCKLTSIGTDYLQQL
jgi:hypothetical protein